MAVIVEVKSGRYTYLYHQTKSWRNENGQVKNKRQCVGKIDPETGVRVFKPSFIESMRNDKDFISEYENLPQFSINDIKNSTVQGFGFTDLLENIATRSNLKEVIEQSNPKYADEIYALAVHLVANGEPFMHTQEWIETVDVPENMGNLSSQRISRILADITQGERDSFYRLWTQTRQEQEYLALDITSTSSYSELISDVEWGYNRDAENLPQINLCLLMGWTSRLPVYQTSYSGSLKDVSTLKTTLEKFDAITEGKPVLIVTDKGFYSESNINALMDENAKFITAVPFSCALAKNEVEYFCDKIDNYSHNIIVGGDTLRAATRECEVGGNIISVHVYFNPLQHTAVREKKFAHVSQMYENACNEPHKYAENKSYQKFLDMQKSDETYTISVKETALENSYKHAGWLVIISNHIKNAKEAISIYRAKDVVEKGFLRLKNNLDLGRIRVHSDDAMHSKLFIGFVALILMSYIHNIMCDKGLYKKYTMKELIRILSKRKVHKLEGRRIENPPTKQQREIMESFGL